MKASLLALALAAVTVQAAARPNFLVIFTDDQGYGDLGCCGATGFRTPRLDILSREGARFNLAEDIGESRNLAGAHPDIVERLTRLAEQFPWPEQLHNPGIRLPRRDR